MPSHVTSGRVRDACDATMSTIPRIGAPATRALEHAGVRGLEELANWSEQDLLALHGMGPRAVGILRERLADEGLTFRS